MRQAELPPALHALSADARNWPELPAGARIVEHGDHGPVIDGLQGRWSDAVDWLKGAQSGDARGVLEHRDVPGRIDVIWGDHDARTGNGYGLAHILARHPEVAEDLPERMARMRKVKSYGNRMQLSDGTSTAVVATNFAGRRKTWLLTAYEKKGPDERGRAPGDRSGFVPTADLRSARSRFYGAEGAGTHNIAGAEGEAKIDATYDVVSGANSSKDPNGPVYIDRHIPQFSPLLKDRNGEPADLWKYLAVHERTEAVAMARAEAAFKEEHGRAPNAAELERIYKDAHTFVATPAERVAVEADGVDWKAYTHEIDGYLDHIEREKAVNPPLDAHIDPEAAIGHHRSQNKQAVPEEKVMRAPAQRGPRARPEETWSLLEFLASRGGISPNDHLISDLRAAIGRDNKFIPGFGNLIRKGGMSLDRAREVAVEAGYLFDPTEVSGLPVGLHDQHAA